MSCSITERVTDKRAGGGGSQAQGGAGPAGATVAGTAAGCRLRGTSASNSSLATSPNSRVSNSQNGPQSGSQGAPARTKPCCIFWCCCCKCPCSNPGGKANDENGPTRTSNNSDLMVNCETDPPPCLEEIRSWGRSFDKLMKSPGGRKVFGDFLRGEYSEENILFWLACEELKRETNPEVIEEKARIIYEDYISILSPKEVSLDSRVREIVNRNMVEPTPHTFEEAQLQIYTLMHRDSYPRFVNSPLYRSLSQQAAPGSSALPSATTTAMVTVSSGDGPMARAKLSIDSPPNPIHVGYCKICSACLRPKPRESHARVPPRFPIYEDVIYYVKYCIYDHGGLHTYAHPQPEVFIPYPYLHPTFY